MHYQPSSPYFPQKGAKDRSKEWTYALGPFDFQAHLFCQEPTVQMSNVNSSGLSEVKCQPMRLRSNSHSTFLSALCQGGGGGGTE